MEEELIKDLRVLGVRLDLLLGIKSETGKM